MIKLGKLKVEGRQGDLTKQKADAICNPANSQMHMGGGAAGALKRAGGGEIEREAIGQAPVPVGRAILTNAGKLRARWVVHAPTMECPAMSTTGENVYRATVAALMAADGAGAMSIVLPGMGTGVGGVSFEDAARVMVKAITDLSEVLSSLQEIILCDLSKEMVNAWKKELDR